LSFANQTHYALFGISLYTALHMLKNLLCFLCCCRLCIQSVGFRVSVIAADSADDAANVTMLEKVTQRVDAGKCPAFLHVDVEYTAGHCFCCTQDLGKVMSDEKEGLKQKGKGLARMLGSFNSQQSSWRDWRVQIVEQCLHVDRPESSCPTVCKELTKSCCKEGQRYSYGLFDKVDHCFGTTRKMWNNGGIDIGTRHTQQFSVSGRDQVSVIFKGLRRFFKCAPDATYQAARDVNLQNLQKVQSEAIAKNCANLVGFDLALPARTCLCCTKSDGPRWVWKKSDQLNIIGKCLKLESSQPSRVHCALQCEKNALCGPTTRKYRWPLFTMQFRCLTSDKMDGIDGCTNENPGTAALAIAEQEQAASLEAIANDAVAGQDGSFQGEASADGFKLGMEVQWLDADRDVPQGTVGKVIKVGLDVDGGGVEVEYDFGHFIFPASELQQISLGDFRLHDKVRWLSEDEDVPADAVGEIKSFVVGQADVRFPSGTYLFPVDDLKLVERAPEEVRPMSARSERAMSMKRMSFKRGSMRGKTQRKFSYKLSSLRKKRKSGKHVSKTPSKRKKKYGTGSFDSQKKRRYGGNEKGKGRTTTDIKKGGWNSKSRRRRRRFPGKILQMGSDQTGSNRSKRTGRFSHRRQRDFNAERPSHRTTEPEVRKTPKAPFLDSLPLNCKALADESDESQNLNPGSDPVHILPVHEDSATMKTINEFLHVTQRFQLGKGSDTADYPTYLGLGVVGAWKINNTGLSTQFEAMKKQMHEYMPNGAPTKVWVPLTDDYAPIPESEPLDSRINEKYFYHGTQASTILKIACNGFHDGKGLLGFGTYLADMPEKSDQYATDPSAEKDRTMKDYSTESSPYRRAKGDVFYALIVRSLLGNSFVGTCGCSNCPELAHHCRRCGRVKQVQTGSFIDVHIGGHGIGPMAHNVTYMEGQERPFKRYAAADGPAVYHSLYVQKKANSCIGRFNEAVVPDENEGLLYPEFIVAYQRCRNPIIDSLGKSVPCEPVK